MDITALTVSNILGYALIFVRISSCMVSMPGISERYVPVRIRLLIAITMTIATYPLVEEYLPKNTNLHVLELFIIIIKEITIGLFFGLTARIILSSSHVAGMIIGYQSGLASAVMFDPNTGSQGSTIGAFLTLVTTVLFFTFDLHHLLLLAVMDSYSLFPINGDIFSSDMSHFITKTVAESFLIAIKLSAPYIVLGLLMYIGAGITSRLMPNMQVFFVLMPVQILIGFGLLAITLSVSMLWYMNKVKDKIGVFIPM